MNKTINVYKTELWQDMLKQPHLLIAGATGSGKSVLINNLMYDMMANKSEFILIDPKRVELVDYSDTKLCIKYASEPKDMVNALNHAMKITEERYKVMQKKRIKKYDGTDVYVVIDEFADLMTTNRKAVQPLIQRLAQIGRAAKVHIILATQCPLRTVIPTEIKVNFDARVGLRTRSAQDSRNILGVTGLENLPRYGELVYMTPEGMNKYDFSPCEDHYLKELIEFFTPTINVKRGWFK